MENYCEHCGTSLKNAEYVLPWEDEDNEAGYWICRQCHKKTIDWSTVDDD